MPDQASGVTPVTCSCQPSTSVFRAPNGNGCWIEPGPVRGAGVGVGAGATSVSGVGAGTEAALGRTNVMGVGFAALVAGAAGTGRSPWAGGSGGGARSMFVAAMAAPELSPTATVYVPAASAGRLWNGSAHRFSSSVRPPRGVTHTLPHCTCGVPLPSNRLPTRRWDAQRSKPLPRTST